MLLIEAIIETPLLFNIVKTIHGTVTKIVPISVFSRSRLGEALLIFVRAQSMLRGENSFTLNVFVEHDLYPNSNVHNQI